jgi:acetyl-CoA acetyltransferase
MSIAMTRKAAIVGIGATEFSKDSGRTEMRLALEAVKAALDDCGLKGSDVDGMTSFSMDNNWENEILRQVGGKELKFFARTEFGGGAAVGPFVHAAMAIASGLCEVVVVYRALNERSGLRFGSGQLFNYSPLNPNIINFSHYFPYGFMTPAAWIAFSARRYMHEYGATSEDFGRVAVAMRDFAATNPKAFFYQRPLTLEQHQTARMIADPLRLHDCCQESDGAVAFVITSAERARSLPHTPAVIASARQSIVKDTRMMTPFYGDTLSGIAEFDACANDVYQMAGLSPADIDVACLYDHFSPWVLPQLEAFGFCGRGEAKDFVREGHIGRGGSLPVNPHGGQLGEAYIHGMNGIAEAVRQIRGSSVNQHHKADRVLITAGAGVPTGAAILEKGA